MLNPGLLALLSGLCAQAAKVLVEVLAGRRWQPSLLFSSGGMPSSHTATVVTLALAIGTLDGFSSPLFSLVLVFGLFVIFEATGLRQEIGKQAEVLNDIMDSALAGEQFDQRRLRQLVGHTWAEVLGGAACGVAFWYLWLIQRG